MAGELLTGFPNIFRAIYDYVNPPAPKATPKKAASKTSPTPAPTKKKPKPGGKLDAASAAINWGLPFDVGNRIGAALAPVSDAVLGTHYSGDRDYSERLQAIRDQADATMAEHPYIATTAAIPTMLVSGGALTRGASGTANLLAKAPGVIGKAGKVAQAATTLEKGRKLANAGKIALGGVAYAGTDEALNGGDLGDIAESAAIGGVAAPAVAGGLKGLGWISRPVVDLFASKNFGQILRRVTNTTMEDLAAKRAAYKARTDGAEPTLAELLPKEDLDNIGKMVIRNSPNLQEQAAGALKGRAASVGPDMLNSVEAATGNRVRGIQENMATDLAASRGRSAARTGRPGNGDQGRRIEDRAEATAVTGSQEYHGSV